MKIPFNIYEFGHFYENLEALDEKYDIDASRLHTWAKLIFQIPPISHLNCYQQKERNVWT